MKSGLSRTVPSPEQASLVGSRSGKCSAAALTSPDSVRRARFDLVSRPFLALVELTCTYG